MEYRVSPHPLRPLRLTRYLWALRFHCRFRLGDRHRLYYLGGRHCDGCSRYHHHNHRFHHHHHHRRRRRRHRRHRHRRRGVRCSHDLWKWNARSRIISPRSSRDSPG